MIAIKDIEKPTDCKKCPLMGTDGNPKDLFSPMMCIAIWATTYEIKHCVGGKILDDCPLVEIEPLSDEEKRIFLSAMGKERVICKQIDIDKVDDGSIKKLVPIVNTIECKVKKVLWN